jgi:hypothetical protein
VMISKYLSANSGVVTTSVATTREFWTGSKFYRQHFLVFPASAVRL